MSLTFAPRTVRVGDREIAVRGLTLNDLRVLVEHHRAELTLLFEAAREDGDTPAWQALLDRLLTAAPEVTARAIALATGETDLDALRALPLGVTAILAEAVLTETMAGSAGKKAMAALIPLPGAA